MRDRDLGTIAALFAPAILLPFGLWAAGYSLFWGDLSYLHHPWRALASEIVQRGGLPLWDPYAYLGMPLAAEMQCAAWYPGTVPFYLFPFAGGLAAFHTLHFGLAGCFAYLWLRSEGLSRAACFGGAALFMGCGSLVSRAPFLNHLSTLAFLPAFLLFRRSIGILALAFSLSFLSGYPLMMAGGALMSGVLPWMLGDRRSLKPWMGAGLLAGGLCACLLLPAMELTLRSHRGAGLGLQDTLLFGLTLADWRQWISPIAVPAKQFSVSIYWWKSCYLGFFGWLAILLAAPRLSRRALIGGAVILAFIGTLLLGGSNALSLWLWSHLPPLRFVRYPGNLAYLLLPLFALLAAAGLHRRSWAAGLAAAAAAELFVYAAFSQPVMPSRHYTDAGPLVRLLQSNSEHRYHISPNALHLSTGADLLDWRHRLYGLTNLPFHLSAIGNFGEPLVPAKNYDFMDYLFSRQGLDGAAPYLPWSDATTALTRDRLPVRKLRYEGQTLWHRYSLPLAISRAAWLSPAEGAKFPSETAAVADLAKFHPRFLSVVRPRTDRLSVHGTTDEGWLVLSDPDYPGWEARINGRPTASLPALGVFQRFRVPAGAWRFELRYAPGSWEIGLAMTLTFLWGAAGYWYNRLRW